MKYCKFAKFITNQNVNLIFAVVGMMDKIRAWNKKNITNYYFSHYHISPYWLRPTVRPTARPSDRQNARPMISSSGRKGPPGQ